MVSPFPARTDTRSDDIEVSQDNWGGKNDPNVSHASSTRLGMRGEPSVWDAKEVWLQFQLPPAVEFRSASLTLEPYEFSNHDDLEMEICLVNEDVVVDDLTWNTRPTDVTYLTTDVIPDSAEGSIYTVVLPTAGMVSGESYILRLRLMSYSWCVFKSRERGTGTPKLSLTYGPSRVHRTYADFNNDGYHDIVVGAPAEEVDGKVNAGGIYIHYGGDYSMEDSTISTIHQEALGESSNEYDQFGDTIAAGNFDGDEYTDLAIGVPMKDVNGKEDAGVVYVLYGSGDGFITPGEVWSQDDIDGCTPESGDKFGFALATGDFDNNGCDDLAIGVPEESIGSKEEAGMICVLYGDNETSNGLTTNGIQRWHQDMSGIKGIVEEGDRFGFSLAAGDFDCDGDFDLAIGVPGEDPQMKYLPEKVVRDWDSGAVQILYSGEEGLSATDDLFDQEDFGGRSEWNDRFGFSLAAGDFDGNGWTDLVVGTPCEDFNLATEKNAGEITVIYGASTGLNDGRSPRTWHQDSDGISGNAQGEDYFGFSVTTGDFNQDNYSDLAVGVPGENLGAIYCAGAVNIIYGSGTGLSNTGNHMFSQDDIGGIPFLYDWFGTAVSAGDFNQDEYADLAIGAPGGDQVNFVYGSGTGLDISHEKNCLLEKSAADYGRSLTGSHRPYLWALGGVVFIKD